MTFGHYGPRSTEACPRNSGRTRNSRPTEIFKSAHAPKTGVFGQALVSFALRKQDRRQTSNTDGTDRPDWTTPVFRYTSKVSRQVLRFFKHCFHKPASQALYEAQLRPLLLAYL